MKQKNTPEIAVIADEVADILMKRSALNLSVNETSFRRILRDVVGNHDTAEEIEDRVRHQPVVKETFVVAHMNFGEFWFDTAAGRQDYMRDVL